MADAQVVSPNGIITVYVSGISVVKMVLLLLGIHTFSLHLIVDIANTMSINLGPSNTDFHHASSSEPRLIIIEANEMEKSAPMNHFPGRLTLCYPGECYLRHLSGHKRRTFDGTCYWLLQGYWERLHTTLYGEFENENRPFISWRGYRFRC